MGKAARNNPNSRLVSLPVLQERSCGSCTACCTLPQINEFSKPMFTPCSLLKQPDEGGSCSIWDDRPIFCREYNCLWRRGLGKEEHRPDRLGAMLVASTGYIPGTRFLGVAAHEVHHGALEREGMKALLAEICEGRTVYAVRRRRPELEPVMVADARDGKARDMLQYLLMHAAPTAIIKTE